MDSLQEADGEQLQAHSHYAQHLAAGVDLPEWAPRSFGVAELAVFGALRDAAYHSPTGTCTLPLQDIARQAEVSTRTAARAITLAIAAGLIERAGSEIANRHIHYKVG